MSTIIRPAIATDVPTILRFIRELAEFEKLLHEVQATEQQLSASLFAPGAKAHALIAERDGMPVGFCLYFYNYSTFLARPGIYIEDVYVQPAHRSHGIGRQFFTHLAAQAQREGCGRLEWWVLDWNERALDFYRRLGAEPMTEWTVQRLQGEALAALAATHEQEAA